jgi:hypothetical protein
MDLLASPNIWAHEPVAMALVESGLVSKVWLVQGPLLLEIASIEFSIIITTDLHILSICPDILVASAS